MNDMRFENFIISETNKEAFYYAKIASNINIKDFSPLFILGESGVGKTHLLNAIANSI